MSPKTLPVTKLSDIGFFMLHARAPLIVDQCMNTWFPLSGDGDDSETP